MIASGRPGKVSRYPEPKLSARPATSRLRSASEIHTMAIAMGGHVRVGFEDNVYYRKGELADSNARFVERVVRIAREVGREPATIDEARSMLRIRASGAA